VFFDRRVRQINVKHASTDCKFRCRPSYTTHTYKQSLNSLPSKSAFPSTEKFQSQTCTNFLSHRCQLHAQKLYLTSDKYQLWELPLPIHSFLNVSVASSVFDDILSLIPKTPHSMVSDRKRETKCRDNIKKEDKIASEHRTQ
jgi:hypothetical protein